MARKEKLPPGVSSFLDRHGKRRYRWRSKGCTVYLRSPPGTKEFLAEVGAAKSSRSGSSSTRPPPGTVAWLAERYLASAFFAGGKSKSTQRTSELILEKFVAAYGKHRVADFRFDHIEAILLRAAAPRTEKGRKLGGPSAALNLRGELLPLFRYAMRLGLVTVNPVELATPPKAPRGGFHTWTEEEIAQYRARHQLGTKARLALEIFLWTAQRRGDASTFGRQHLAGGKVTYTQAKTGKTLSMPAAPQLLAAIAAMPATGIETFLVTDYGKPFSRAGLGNKMRQWCDEAGLPRCTAHGLRKAAARRVAEGGGTNLQLKAFGGWGNDREVGTYTAAADQARLAEEAISRVVD